MRRLKRIGSIIMICTLCCVSFGNKNLTKATAEERENYNLISLNSGLRYISGPATVTQSWGAFGGSAKQTLGKKMSICNHPGYGTVAYYKMKPQAVLAGKWTDMADKKDVYKDSVSCSINSDTAISPGISVRVAHRIPAAISTSTDSAKFTFYFN